MNHYIVTFKNCSMIATGTRLPMQKVFTYAEDSEDAQERATVALEDAGICHGEITSIEKL